jgi:hypothetical protein
VRVRALHVEQALVTAWNDLVRDHPHGFEMWEDAAARAAWKARLGKFRVLGETLVDVLLPVQAA